MSKHTELPWAARINKDAGFQIIGDGMVIVRRDLYPKWELNAECEANADFIIRACNSHDELVEALIKARATIKAWHGDIAWEMYQKSPEMTVINKAIAKAEGE